MKIQKGIVKYKDREDIICTYGVTDDNRQYYFLDENDEKKFSNGNRIASKDLKEAIDPMVKASQVGVIDENGNEVIPFVNRTIRPVNDDIILVEIANPVSQEVIDAINLKSDPSAATQLVSTTSTIKDNLNQKMNGNGRFLFNDIFSEATVADINGNNLVNGEYYSFIGLANDKLYFSKNTADSQITEYSILPPEVQSDITPNSDTNDINVNNVEVPTEVVENALSGTNDINQGVPATTDASAEVPPVVGEDTVTVDNNVVAPNVDVTNDALSSAVESVAPPLGLDTVSETSDVVTSDNIQAEGVAVDIPVDVAANDVSANTVVGDVVGNNVETSVDASVEVPTDASVAVGDAVSEIPDDNNINNVVVPSVVDVNINNSVVPSEVDANINNSVVPSEVDANINNSVVSPEADTNIDSSIVPPVVDTNPVDVPDVVVPPIVEETPAQVDSEAEEVVDNTVNDSEEAVSDVSSQDVTLPEVTADQETVDEEIKEASQEDVVESEDTKEESNSEEEIQTEEVDSSEQTVDIFKETEDKKEEVQDEVEVKKEVKKPKKPRRMPFSSVLPDKPVDIEDEEIEETDSIVSTSKRERTALDKLFQDTSEDSISDEFEDSMNDELYNDTSIDLDDIDVSSKIDVKHDYNDAFEEHDYKENAPISGKDTIMSDIAKSMTNLMKQNRELKASLLDSRNRYEKISASRRNIADRAKMLEQKNDILGTKLHNEETMKNKAMAKINTLEAKVREQERIIASQTRELNSLRPQLAGKEDLVKILADASLLLDEDSNYNYDDGDSYYHRAA